jgi:hypothetical protein
MLKLKVE